MPRRSPRLRHYYEGDDTGSSSSAGGSSLMAHQRTVYTDSPPLRDPGSKPRSLSPDPELCSAANLHTTSKTQSVFRESYFGGWATLVAKNAILNDQLEGDSYGSGDYLGRKTPDTDCSESSSKGKVKCDTRDSMSGYFSEDDCAGRSVTEQPGFASIFRNFASQVIAFLQIKMTSLAWMSDLFSFCLCTIRSCLSPAAAFLYRFVLKRRFSTQKNLLLILLLLLLLLLLLVVVVVVLASLVSGACWYFCPYALKEAFSRDHIRKELTTIRAQHLDNLQKEMDSWALQCKSEQQRLAQDAVPENMLKKQSLLEAQLTGLRQELASLSQKQAADKQQILLLQQNMEALQSQFRDWTTEFLLRDKEALNELPQNLEHRIFMPVAGELGKSPKEDAAILGLTVNRGVTKEEVHQIIKQALKVYSEDRIGLVDYALESSGGRIITSHCSNSYNTRKAYISVFGIPVWYFYQPPRVILQPQVQPGNCWAFRGPQGFVRVHLSACIHITAVTLEHVPKAMSPTNNIPSAPKDFVIFGLKEDLQAEGVTLGQFTYDRDGEPIQTFYFRDNITATYQVVELRILGNWGHPEYTCIYRFRVHGEPAQ
ncbi:SUN domain-containing protein 2-like [Dromiciops gliroides]|uniref:SUN domain-containing protein 2-like n=1 Tax=Dromiciops gliroides TaxID=33562 RepID=UPI001CC5592D|nr:SUN domain-containing protein 2-like [Dromiciops gliroides]